MNWAEGSNPGEEFPDSSPLDIVSGSNRSSKAAAGTEESDQESVPELVQGIAPDIVPDIDQDIAVPAGIARWDTGRSGTGCYQ